jgi:hypothetical protein
MFGPVQPLPELGSSLTISGKEVFTWHVFFVQQPAPHWIFFIDKFSNPFDQQAIIHSPGINYTQASKLFWCSERFPFSYMVLNLGTTSLPEKSPSYRIQLFVLAISQVIKPHHVSGDTTEARIHQN